MWSHSLPTSESRGSSLSWEPFRPRGLVSPGPHPGTARSWVPVGTGRGVRAAGKEAHWISAVSPIRSVWKASGRRAEQGCRRFAWPGCGHGGPSRSSPSARSYLQALQRETKDSLGTADFVTFTPTVPAPLTGQRGTGFPLAICPRRFVCGTLRRLSPLISLNKYSNSSCPEMVLLQKKVSP